VSSLVCRRLVAVVGKCDESRDLSLPGPRDRLRSQSHVVVAQPTQSYVIAAILYILRFSDTHGHTNPGDVSHTSMDLTLSENCITVLRY